MQITDRIPRRILHIYSAPDSEEMSLLYRAAITATKLLHTDFDHVLFTDKDIHAFVAAEFPQYHRAMERFSLPIQRLDFFRYLAVYRLGGFYLDMDVLLAQSLSPLLRYECVLPFEELTVYDHLRREHAMDWEVANYGFGAAPQNPFIGSVIDNCIRGLEDPHWANEMLHGIPRWFRTQFVATVTTGPGMVSRTLAERPDLSRNVTVLFPPDVRLERHWHHFGEFGVHLMLGSWRKRDGIIRSRLARIWESRRRAAGQRKSEMLGPERRGPWINHSLSANPIPVS